MKELILEGRKTSSEMFVYHSKSEFKASRMWAVAHAQINKWPLQAFFSGTAQAVLLWIVDQTLRHGSV